MRESALRKVANGSLRILPFEEIERRVLEGTYQFHNFGTFWVWTQITEYQNDKVLEVVLILGDGVVERAKEVVDHLVTVGKQHGCDAVEAWVRRGLEPVLKPLGWKRRKILLRKELK